ncbi:peptide-methionine (R)-S-oxide reductase MsrB [Acetobacteraceae bacterium ESL0709]|nr:peptide-methionine (R)-S-oxide reductase MsrB [Acetobacteraceae bacterium ESL0697]MDF7678639.1 peptide-methionine (R)-S-oxide reductase MsrB [Acetobacteraceae bacterium ESL0709]
MTQNSFCGFGPLSPVQKQIMDHHGTEPPGSSPLNHEKRAGTYYCVQCGEALFSSREKYESGSGWPSFCDVLKGAVGVREDCSHGMTRTEVHCARCQGHLGHVFHDGPPPTGLRYCVNGTVLEFCPQEQSQEETL